MDLINDPHSANWLAAGVASEAQTGEDIEQFRSHRNVLKIANYLGWKELIDDIRDFHAKWTLWEASAKCVEASVVMTENPGFEQLCNANKRHQVYASRRWNGLHRCFDKKLFYAIVMNGQRESTLTHRILEPGEIVPW